MKYPFVATFLQVKKQVLLSQSCRGGNKKAGLKQGYLVKLKYCQLGSVKLNLAIYTMSNELYDVKLLKSGSPRCQSMANKEGWEHITWQWVIPQQLWCWLMQNSCNSTFSQGCWFPTCEYPKLKEKRTSFLVPFLIENLQTHTHTHSHLSMSPLE